MAKEGRGLICLALPGDRIDALGLSLMSTNNSSRHETAFTISIEARDECHHGHPPPPTRARTVAVAIDPDPGCGRHCHAGSCTFRSAPATAAFWCALAIPRPRSISPASAGLNASGVICEVMNDDGSMARLPDLVSFAQRPPWPEDRHDLRP